MEATRTAVLDSGADLGIMLDTDVDRSGVVDRAGNGARPHAVSHPALAPAARPAVLVL